MDQYSENEVKNALSDFHPRIKSIVCRAFSEWVATSDWKLANGFHPVRYSRTIANDVFDAIANIAIEEFGEDPRVQIIIEPQTIKLCFDTVIIGRFKKSDDHDLGRNIPTQAVLDYITPQLQLPNFPPAAAKVEFNWSANDIGTEISTVLVVARDQDSILWSYNIDQVDSTADKVDILPLPSSTGPNVSDGDYMISPKKIKDTKHGRE